MRTNTRLFLTAVLGGMAIAVVGTLLSGLDSNDPVVIAMSSAALLALGCLGFRSVRAGVRLDKRLVIYRGYWRTQKIDRDGISLFSTEQVDSKILFEVHAPVAQLRNGRSVVLAALAGACLEGRPPGKVDTRTKRLNDWLKT